MVRGLMSAGRSPRSVARAIACYRGFYRFMVVDGHGHMLTQRVVGALARLETAIESDALRLRYEGVERAVALRPTGGRQRRVRVFQDEVEALDLGDTLRQFLSDALGRDACPDLAEVVEDLFGRGAHVDDHRGFIRAGIRR